MELKKPQSKTIEKQEHQKAKVFYFFKKEGWFTFKIVEVSQETIDKAPIIYESNPDIFAVFINQVIEKIRKVIFEL